MNSQAKFSVSFSLQQTVFAVFLCLELQRMKFFPVKANFVVAPCAFVFCFHTGQTVELDKPNKKNDDTCSKYTDSGGGMSIGIESMDVVACSMCSKNSIVRLLPEFRHLLRLSSGW
jgi:hypothetical protein